MKFRIIYKVVEELPDYFTERKALESLENMADDLDEHAAEACSLGKVRAVLQVWVPMPTEALPNNGQWSDLHSV